MKKVGVIVVFSVAAIWFGSALAAPAEEDAAALVKDANAALRNAQSSMFSGRTAEAQAELDRAAQLVAALEQTEPGNAQLYGLKEKLWRQKKDLEKRAGSAAAAAKSTPARTPSSVKTHAAGLPGGVTSRIKKIDAELAKAVEALQKEGVASTEWRREAAQGHLNAARGILGEIEKGYGAQIPADDPQINALRERMAAAEHEVAALGENRAAADQQKAALDDQRTYLSADWLQKLKPYEDFYGEKRLITEPTSTAKNLKGQEIFFKEAQALLAQYNAASFPGGKTEELDQAGRRLKGAVEAFPEMYQGSLALIMEEPRNQLTRMEGQLAQKLKAAGTDTPIDNDWIAGVRRDAAEIADVLPAGAPEVKELEKRLADVEAGNAELRKRWVANTLMKPDKYRGGDASQLKAKAVEVVKKEHGDANALRTTLITANWSEEKVVEWTDTTRTAIRYRVTRSMSAQVAGKRGADVFLYTIHLAQDQKSDGSWGATYGHIMFTDPMLEKNVKRDAP